MKFKIVLAIILVSTFITPPAQAVDKGYRYWGYFQAAPNKTAWTAAMTGPTVDIADGSVEGWAFVFSSNDIPAIEPMMDPDFATLCGQTPETSGKIRVGLVVDFGAGNIAPDGEIPNEFFSDCVVVDKGSVGLDVLEAALDVRAGDSGLIWIVASAWDSYAHNKYPSQKRWGHLISLLVVAGLWLGGAYGLFLGYQIHS